MFKFVHVRFHFPYWVFYIIGMGYENDIFSWFIFLVFCDFWQSRSYDKMGFFTSLVAS